MKKLKKKLNKLNPFIKKKKKNQKMLLKKLKII